MKKLLTFFLAGVAIAALGTTFTACNAPKDPEVLEQGEDVPFSEYTFEEGITGEQTSARWVNLDGEYGENGTSIVIINSDDELRGYVDGELPSVDFTQKTLLIAYGYAGRGFREAEVESFSIMPDNNYRLNVTALLYDHAIIDRWLIAILTDKIEQGSKIEVSVKFPDTWPE